MSYPKVLILSSAEGAKCRPRRRSNPRSKRNNTSTRQIFKCPPEIRRCGPIRSDPTREASTASWLTPPAKHIQWFPLEDETKENAFNYKQSSCKCNRGSSASRAAPRPGDGRGTQTATWTCAGRHSSCTFNPNIIFTSNFRHYYDDIRVPLITWSQWNDVGRNNSPSNFNHELGCCQQNNSLSIYVYCII